MADITIEEMATAMATLQDDFRIVAERAQFAVDANHHHAGHLAALRFVLNDVLRAAPIDLNQTRRALRAAFGAPAHGALLASALLVIDSLESDRSS